MLQVEHIWKRYGFPPAEWVRQAWRRLRGGQADTTWALQDVSFELARGEILGVIGENGAGKSTLLQVLAGVTQPTRGTIRRNGRIFSMIELTAGVHPELTGRENIYFLGALTGFTRRDVDARMPAIEEFCELGEWFDKPFRMYSSGMKARLGFSMAMHAEADILLVDEVLAVGDAAFRRKCLKQFGDLRVGGCSMIFVSHAIHQVERLCGRAILLDHGRIIASGASEETAIAYYEQVQRKVSSQRDEGTTVRTAWQAAQMEHAVRLLNVRLENEQGDEVSSIVCGAPLTINLEYETDDQELEAYVSVTMSTTDSESVCGFRSECENHPLRLSRRGRVVLRIPSLPLVQGAYFLSWKVIHPLGGALGGGSEIAYFDTIIRGDMRRSACGGFVALRATWSVG